VSRHRFGHLLDIPSHRGTASPVPAAGAFVLCPPGLVGSAPAWQQLYQVAFDQAQRLMQRRRSIERAYEISLN
jgi:hypothetical protein